MRYSLRRPTSFRPVLFRRESKTVMLSGISLQRARSALLAKTAEEHG